MQDGYTQVGAGASDMRIASKDLQHARQDRTADEMHSPVRIVHQSRGDGGPMKHQLEMEAKRHEVSMKHQMHHKEKNAKRHHNSQHGQDTYTY